MAYKVIILYQLYMPSYFLGTFTEYPYLYQHLAGDRGGSGTTCSRHSFPPSGCLAVLAD